MTILFDLRDEDWNDENLDVIRKWLMHVKELMLTIFYDGNKLTAHFSFPFVPIYDVTYFMREPNHIFTVDGFHDEIMFGTLHEDVEGSLLRVLETVYAPMFFNMDLSDNIKMKLFSELHSFLSYLTGIHYKISGLTVLYVPFEGHHLSPAEAARDRELLKRLEVVVNFWMNQIRLCLGDKKQLVPYDLVCHPDEFDFWAYRCKCFS